MGVCMQENESVVQIPLEYFDRLRKLENGCPMITIRYDRYDVMPDVKLTNATDAMNVLMEVYADMYSREKYAYDTRCTYLAKHNAELRTLIEKSARENKELKTRKRKFFGLF